MEECNPQECDPQVRIFCICKNGYAKHCADECPYLVKAQWAPKEGVKYGWIEVICCANGGRYASEGLPVCRNGIEFGLKLGEVSPFDPAMIYKEPPRAQVIYPVQQPIKRPKIRKEKKIKKPVYSGGQRQLG